MNILTSGQIYKTKPSWPNEHLAFSQINFHSEPTIPWSGKGNGEGRQQDGGEDKNGDADRLDSLVDIFVNCIHDNNICDFLLEVFS